MGVRADRLLLLGRADAGHGWSKRASRAVARRPTAASTPTTKGTPGAAGEATASAPSSGGKAEAKHSTTEAFATTSPSREPFGFDDWRRRAAEINARLDAQILALKDQSSGTPEPFRVLGTPWPCTEQQLNARWRELAFQHHPDRGGDVAEFIKLKGAYEQAKRVQAGEPFIVFSYPGH